MEDIVFFMGVNVFISVKYICYIYLVIIDRMEEKMDIFELAVPLETNIKNANTQKMNKYEQFITDIITRDVSVHPFENDSRGYISP